MVKSLKRMIGKPNVATLWGDSDIKLPLQVVDPEKFYQN